MWLITVGTPAALLRGSTTDAKTIQSSWCLTDFWFGAHQGLAVQIHGHSVVVYATDRDMTKAVSIHAILANKVWRSR